jgi:Ca2+/Na+ antiporter
VASQLANFFYVRTSIVYGGNSYEATPMAGSASFYFKACFFLEAALHEVVCSTSKPLPFLWLSSTVIFFEIHQLNMNFFQQIFVRLFWTFWFFLYLGAKNKCSPEYVQEFTGEENHKKVSSPKFERPILVLRYGSKLVYWILLPFHGSSCWRLLQQLKLQHQAGTTASRIIGDSKYKVWRSRQFHSYWRHSKLRTPIICD